MIEIQTAVISLQKANKKVFDLLKISLEICNTKASFLAYYYSCNRITHKCGTNALK